ncbi:MAG: response regulator [Deltaproteobacteria bacterium]|nr:response regulator [Deltaproteobacteria bacterium]
MEASKVLLIDDERALRRTLSLGLLQRGYETAPCQDGFSGLSKIEMFMKRRMPIACVVTDIRLPDIDGLKLLKVIKSLYPDLPVFVISGYGDELTEEIVRKEKGDGFLPKPFTVDDLVAMMEKARRPSREAPSDKALALDTQKEQRSVSSYAFVTMDDRRLFEDVYRKAYFMDKVLYCDAVVGDWQLVLLLQSNSRKDLHDFVQNSLMNIEGIITVELLDVVEPLLCEEAKNVIEMVEDSLQEEGWRRGEKRPNVLSSYLLLEIEEEFFESIYKQLYFMEDVVHCDVAHGRYGFVLLVQAPTFDLIKKRVTHISRNVEGVLKAKELMIMNLLEM